MHWKGRRDGCLPCRLVCRILVDQISTEDEQSLEQGIGHIGPAKLDDVLLDDLHALAGSSFDADIGFSTDILEDLLSTLMQS